MRISSEIPVILREIDAYVSHFSGAPLLVGVDGAEDYRSLLGFLENDGDKHILRVSDSCRGEFPPNPNLLLGGLVEAAREKTVVWLGAAQSIMLQGQQETETFLLKLAGMSLPRPVIVLCPGLCGMLQSIAGRYEKLGYWFVAVPAQARDVPSIRLYASEAVCPENKPLIGMKALIRALEDGENRSILSLVSACKLQWLSSSMFPLLKGLSTYATLCAREPGIKAFTQEEDGAADQWNALARELQKTSFRELCEVKLGNPSQLVNSFGDALSDPQSSFLCFLALKVFSGGEEGYLAECLKRCRAARDLEPRIYDTLLTLPVADPRFKHWLRQRRRLLQGMDENPALMHDFCQRAAILGRDILWALTDATEEERAAIIHALCSYDYSQEELQRVLGENAPQLALYLQEYVFDAYNTRVMESDAYLRTMLTDYFTRYKVQKLTNRLDPDFLDVVEQEAMRRSFTKLQARSAVVKKLNKEGAAPFFFDALGVEYLAYIQARCEEYGMLFDCQIAHGNLPTITALNKEFYDAFPPDSIRKESGLDDIKHEGAKYDYTLTKEPLHIFDELDILDGNLKKFASWLRQGIVQRVIMLSDHGTSRLAVIYESENDKLELPEKGKHSGRCCPCDHDPQIPFAYYEQSSGYAVLANYERFKGSRKADVETHGGATLEEVVVPVITLTAKPKQQTAFFPEEKIQCTAKEGSRIRLYANPPLQQPRMVVRGQSYTGAFEGDRHNVLFTMADIRRKGHYDAEIFDGNRRIATLSFDAERPTRIVDDF